MPNNYVTKFNTRVEIEGANYPTSNNSLIRKSDLFKAPCKLVTEGPIGGTYNSNNKTLTLGNGNLIIDEVAPTVGMRILIANQDNQTQNGIYTLTVAGTVSSSAVLTRASDFNSSEKLLVGSKVAVTEGTKFTNTMWLYKGVYVDNPVLDTTAIQFIQIGSGSGGARKFVELLEPDDITLEYSITHGLNTTNVTWSLVDMQGQSIITKVTVNDENVVTVSFDPAPALGDNMIFTLIAAD